LIALGTKEIAENKKKEIFDIAKKQNAMPGKNHAMTLIHGIFDTTRLK